MADPHWKSGITMADRLPPRGLSVARMVGHITYMSDASMAEKFGRRRKKSTSRSNSPLFEVEGYLHYRGEQLREAV